MTHFIGKIASTKIMKVILALAVVLTTGLFAQTASAHGEWGGAGGVVYVLSNDKLDNQVLVFSRTRDGRLLAEDSYSTGGMGTGASLASQGALIADKDGEWLYAVNAASNDISVFAAFGTRLFLTDKITSGGVNPISLTLHQNMLYVLNDGDAENAANISGFTVSTHGKLMPLAGSTLPLSAAAPDAAQIQFSPDGGVLVVTEKATNMISTYTIGLDNLPSGPKSQPSSGMTPYGFAFDSASHVIVSEAAGGPPNISSVSSYSLAADGTLTTVSGSSTTHQVAACWVAVSKDGKYAWSANTASNSVTGYSIGANGALTLLDANGASGATGAKPTDLGISKNGRYLYSLNAGDQTISAFRVNEGGSLSAVRGVSRLPMGSVGIVVR